MNDKLLLTLDEECELRKEWKKLNPATRMSWRDYWLTGQLNKTKGKIEALEEALSVRNQLLVLEQKRLDRPELREIANLLAQWKDNICRMVESNSETLAESPLEISYKILALVPDIEEVKEQERGRIDKLVETYFETEPWMIEEDWETLKEGK